MVAGFEEILYPNLGRKILLRAISNVLAGRRFPIPGLERQNYVDIVE